MCPALRAATLRPKVIEVVPQCEFVAFASAALEYALVKKALDKGAMDKPKPTATADAFPHSPFPLQWLLSGKSPISLSYLANDRISIWNSFNGRRFLKIKGVLRRKIFTIQPPRLLILQMNS